MPFAGELRTMVTIQQRITSTDPETGEETETFSNYHQRLPAAFESVSGAETRRGLQVEANVKAVFTMRYIRDISPTWRVRIVDEDAEEHTYSIVAITPDAQRVWMDVQCSRVVA